MASVYSARFTGNVCLIALDTSAHNIVLSVGVCQATLDCLSEGSGSKISSDFWRMQNERMNVGPTQNAVTHHTHTAVEALQASCRALVCVCVCARVQGARSCPNLSPTPHVSDLLDSMVWRVTDTGSYTNSRSSSHSTRFVGERAKDRGERRTGECPRGTAQSSAGRRRGRRPHR
jgi:hypothetical protein